MSLFLLGLCLLLLLLASVVIGVTAVHIERQRLQSLADQTSTAVAGNLEGLEVDDAGPQVILTSSRVQVQAENFLRQSGAYQEFTGLALEEGTSTEDGSTATVNLSARAQLPLVSSVVPVEVPIRVTSSARTIFSR
ncbi:MAG: pilus assembly protein TadG-related protein [Rothia sp. (in: high G+C Gram-positive bacteria)]|nr:pilus assembly protein TadG-related protein [Rothia sp. (in: high G+C Gram-positive bacteria)]